ncbi:MAG: anhydro-N-acetylmuramic acid kinase, partial [Terriglobia bacterium]
HLNFVLGSRFAAAALAVCRLGGIPPSRALAIGSHGQTIFHRGPAPRLGAARSAWHGASTLQIGEPAIIAEQTGAPVVADFRSADIAAGGHGAPLVPMVDYLLLQDAKRGIVTLNLGGIANVTVLPRGGRLEDVFGFDTGPGNIVVDALVRRFTRGRKRYDAGGRWASRGRVMERLLAEMLASPFFKQFPPKSAGREQFGAGFVAQFFPKSKRVSQADALRTATELTARSVGEALRRFVIGRVPVQRLVLSGGGAHNRLLRARLTDLLPGIELRLSDDFGLPVDAKEAVAFAVLADRTLRGLPGNIPAVTGARRAVALGKISRHGSASSS